MKKYISLNKLLNQKISINGNTLTASIVSLVNLTFLASDGPYGYLLVEILSPFLLASAFNLSFSKTFFKKESLELECLICSTLIWSLFSIFLYLTYLWIITPTDFGLTLKILPVLPW